MASDRGGAASTPLPPRHGGTRASHHSDLQIPAYARREHWGNPSHDVASYEGVDWKAECDLSTGRREWMFRLPVSDRRVAPPGNRCFQLKRRLPSETQPVLPTLFIPGFPKAATTWLYECMRSAFVPERVCTRSPRKLTEMRSVSTEAWNKSNCRGRRYLLPGISCTLTGGCGHMKESFFYGAGYNPTFKGGLAALHGPEIPLEMFRFSQGKPEGMSSRTFLVDRLKRFESFCHGSSHTHLPEGRMHPACCEAKESAPKRYGCRWHSRVRTEAELKETAWFKSAQPWVVPGTYNFASADFTPNYLCTPSALHNINSTSRDPSELRFIVIMRDPVMRAFSEWSMFTKWQWDREKNLDVRFKQRMDSLIQCNQTLHANPELLKTLPDEELLAYIRKCFKGMAMEYISNSIYVVCLMGALRIFKKEQFLFLRFEDLLNMQGPALVKLLANFTGMYTDDKIIRQLRNERECEGQRAKRKPLSFTYSSKDNTTMSGTARRQLMDIMPMLESFFQPYNKLLREVVHPTFSWGAQYSEDAFGTD